MECHAAKSRFFGYHSVVRCAVLFHLEGDKQEMDTLKSRLKLSCTTPAPFLTREETSAFMPV
jgi:hypothetical protein